MKLVKLFLLGIVAFLFLNVTNLSAQEKPQKNFRYLDTSFSYYGFKVDISRITAYWDHLKCEIKFINPSDNFVIIDPADFLLSKDSSGKKFIPVRSAEIVIPPHITKNFDLKFNNADFQKQRLNLELKGVKLTDKVVETYDFSNLNISKENSKQVGPVKWTLIEKDYDHNLGIRLTAKLVYKGDKFLAIYLDNANLKTKDGGNYFHVGDKGWHLRSYNNYYYQRGSSYEKELLIFPAKKGAVKKAGGDALLSFKDVLKEYSTIPYAGFKVDLIKGNPTNEKPKAKEEEEEDD